MTDSTSTETIESVDSISLRARQWISANLEPLDPDAERPPAGDDDEEWVRARELQKKLHAGGFAGIVYPKEYGGQGLTPAHQQAFTEESMGYEMPLMLNVPTLSICAPVILDHGTEAQKREHLTKVHAGEEVLVQFLSEPSGGSDLAGLITRAERDGDTWVINGAKTWSSAAYAADYGLCLARTDWDAPKHRGLTMFLIPTKGEGLEMRRIKQVSGSTEFCEEFFDDFVVPASAVVGEVNDGWTVASRQLYYERTAVGGGSPYVSGSGARSAAAPDVDLAELARKTNRAEDPSVREMVAEHRAMAAIHHQLVDRMTQAIELGLLPPTAGSIMRLFHAEEAWMHADYAIAVGGSQAVTATPGDKDPLQEVAGINWLMRQGGSLGGGSTEMARNIISERILNMPRELAADRDVPFREVRRSR